MIPTLLARLLHWPTTSLGLAVGGIVMYAFTTLGCHPPTDWQAWGLGLVAALPGLLAK